MRKILKSFKYAFDGIITAFKEEQNMKIHVLVMLAVILAGFVLKISLIEWAICIILFAIVIGGEIMNTSIENAVDLIMPEKNSLAKKIKDLSAGAVLIFAIGSIVVGIIIFLPKILDIIS